MIKNIFLLFVGIMFSTGLLAQKNSAYFVSNPSLSPDGQTIVFSYEGDLWKVNARGGTAYRITAMRGNESHARISPDGKWIAFTGTQDNNPNIYLISINGGEIKQLTFHDRNDFVDSWSWDSKYIYFNSNRYNFVSAYKISVNGGTPNRLFDNYFNTPHHLVEHPLTKSVYFTESWESSIFTNRKKYKGEHNPDIKSYNFETKEFTKYTSYKGKDFWPTIDKKGNVYFVSDEQNGEYNLAVLKNGKTEILTSFTTSIKRPQVSANGGKVVFVKDYQLYLYNTLSKKSELLNISLFQNNTLNIDQSFKVQGKISYFDVSEDGKKIAFVSRGRMFVSDIKGKFIKQIETKQTERVVELKWMKDNVTLLYSRTDKGWANWFSIKADKKSVEKQITFDKHTNRDISMNSDRTKAVYLSGRNFVKIIDLKSMVTKTIVTDEIWAFRNLNPRFSPNDEYVVFTAFRDFEQDIFIHNLKDKTTFNLTNTGVAETDPFWSPDGRYIYFISDRYNTSYPRGTKNDKLYRIALDKFEKEFKSVKYDELFTEKDETKDKKKKDKNKKDENKKKKIIITINLDNINDRWKLMGVKGGEQSSPYIIDTDDESNVLFISNRDKGENELWKTTIKPFEKNKTEKISGTKVNSYSISEAKDKTYLLTGGNIYTLKLSSNKLEKIKFEYSFTKNLDNEFNQLFFETWTTLQENFYDKEFHGMDWTKMKERYSKYLPHLRNRTNLRLVLNEMLGELNASHLRFYSNGDEEKVFHKMKTMSPGIIFDQNDAYKVNYVINNSKSDNKENNIQKGDVITAVNGISVDPKQNRESYFLSPISNEELTLTFNRNGKVFEKRIHPENSGRVNILLYDEWIKDNQNYVDKKSKKRIAYVYMKNMGGTSLNNFLIEMSSEGQDRDALILDLRYNRGGNVHDEVLNYLSRKPYFHWKYREGKKTTHPNVTPSAKPIILLINEHSLSDAEVTANGFKELKLGKIIGTETYRWIIFTSGKSLVDGSFCRIPAWGCYTLDGKDLEKEGVKPDIYMDTNFKNRLENNDPQLDKAIKEIMKELK